MSAESCRLRKCACPRCGYVARITRLWLRVGLLRCPCGGVLIPAAAEDRELAGLREVPR
jgi:hypothetical protein